MEYCIQWKFAQFALPNYQITTPRRTSPLRSLRPVLGTIRHRSSNADPFREWSNCPTLQLWDSIRLSRCGTPRFLVLLPIFPNPSTSVPCVTFPSFNHPRDTEAPTVVIKDHVFMSPPLVSHLFTCGSFPLTRLPYITAIILEIQQLLLHHFTDVLVPPVVSTRSTHCVPASTMDWLSCTPCIWFDLVHFGNHNSDTSKGACRACTGNT